MNVLQYSANADTINIIIHDYALRKGAFGLSRYQIAGFSVEIPDTSRTMCRIAADYAVDPTGSPDITLSIDEHDMAQYMRQLPHASRDTLEAQVYGLSFFKQQPDHGSLSLHASALVMDGGAYLFSAPSGTGKSTHARLWQQRFGDRVTVINDDKPALRIVDGVCHAFGTPWCGKHQINANISAPLKALVFLKRGDRNDIRRLSGKEVFGRVLEQCLCVINTPGQMMNLMDILDKLLRTTPVYELACTIDEQAAQLVYDTVNKE